MPRETEADRLVRREKAQLEAIKRATQADVDRDLATQRAKDLQEVEELIPRLLRLLHDRHYPFMQTIRVEDRKAGLPALVFDLRGRYDKAAWYLFTTSMYYVDGYTKSNHYFLSDGRFYYDGLFSDRPKSIRELARTGGGLQQYLAHLQELFDKVQNS